jgi:hypothetical protein
MNNCTHSHHRVFLITVNNVEICGWKRVTSAAPVENPFPEPLRGTGGLSIQNVVYEKNANFMSWDEFWSLQICFH